MINKGNLRQKTRARYDIEFGGGLGEFSGKGWRIGLMGHSSTKHKVERLLKSIGNELKKNGVASDTAIGFKAVQATCDHQRTGG